MRSDLADRSAGRAPAARSGTAPAPATLGLARHRVDAHTQRGGGGGGGRADHRDARLGQARAAQRARRTRAAPTGWRTSPRRRRAAARSGRVRWSATLGPRRPRIRGAPARRAPARGRRAPAGTGCAPAAPVAGGGSAASKPEQSLLALLSAGGTSATSRPAARRARAVSVPTAARRTPASACAVRPRAVSRPSVNPTADGLVKIAQP